MNDTILEVDDLTIEYETKSEPLKAVSNASFSVGEREYRGVVGESGCGKSTLAKAIVGALDDNGKITSGSIRYRGQEIHNMSEQELNEEIRWKEISWIPQSSMNSLDPMKRVNEQALELAKIHTDLSKEEALDQFREMFEIVGLQPSRISDYPHQYSGGMQQRAVIALALFLEPSLLIADEPTTALDVIMQDQIFKYLDRIKDNGVSMLLITHDISVVFESCDTMTVMHGGQSVESGSVEQIYDSPMHPYSVLLQEAFPDYRYPDRELSVIQGDPPEQWGEVDYCTFADRCPIAVDKCRRQSPDSEALSADGADPAHRVSCYRKDDIDQLRDEASQTEPVQNTQGK